MEPADIDPEFFASNPGRLKAGAHGLDREGVEAHRRRRLIGAMIEAVSEVGYPDTSIERLVGLAEISKSDFYLVFPSKDECFWAAFELVLERFAAATEAIIATKAGGREQVIATIATLATSISQQPQAVSLLLVDSLALGPAADDPRRRSQERFETLLQGAFSEATGSPLPTLTARGMVVGLRRVAYRALRDSSGPALARGAGALAEWILAYAAPAPEADSEITVTASPTEPPSGLAWDEPPGSVASRMDLSQRQRIMRAVAQLVTEDGYEKLTIPSISARAGTSNQTLYSEFGKKKGAVLATFEALIEPVLAAVEATMATAATWEAGLAAATATLVDSFADDPLLSRFVFTEMPRIGREGLEPIDRVMDRLATTLAPGSARARKATDELVVAATIGGFWGILREEAAGGGATSAAVDRTRLLQFLVVGLA